jgi:hypothetical protein
MKPSRVELAVLNNTRWYEAIFEAHGLASEVDGRVWLSHQTAPPFHSNLVVLSPSTSQSDIEAYVAALEMVPRPGGWSLKDSYACLDLSSLGFTPLFQAEWIWRDPVPTGTHDTASGLAWARVSTATELREWEDAWAGDAGNAAAAARATRQFPEQLLASPHHAFFSGRLHGRVVAGGIANRSPGTVGLSNVFSPQAYAEASWDALVRCISTVFPNAPLVGYERGADLQLAKGVGFVTIGPLRVWCRAA